MIYGTPPVLDLNSSCIFLNISESVNKIPICYPPSKAKAGYNDSRSGGSQGS
jgi:hypothetical protein